MIQAPRARDAVWFAVLTGMGLLIAPFVKHPLAFMAGYCATNTCLLLLALTLRRIKEITEEEDE